MSNENKTVFLVDDDQDILTQLKFELNRSGYNVITAESQADAEAMIKDISPDVAVFDLMMENSDSGFTLCYHMKKKHPGVPVILVTAVTSETGLSFETVNSHERAWINADAILNKPVRGEQLKGEIERLTKK